MMNKYNTKVLKFKGSEKDKSYDGHDPIADAVISVKAGDVVEVSDQKAEQLLADFPNHFEEHKGHAPAKEKEAAPVEHAPAKGKKK